MSYGSPPVPFSSLTAWRIFSAVLTRPVLFPVNHDEAPLPTREQVPGPIANFPFMIQLTTVAAGDKSFNDNVLVGADRLQIFHAQLRRDGVFAMKPACLAHDFVQQDSDDSAVKKSRAALVFIAKLKTPDDALTRVVLLEGQLHAARVCAAAAEASISRFGVESHRAVAQAVLLKPLRAGPSLARDKSWSDQRHARHFRPAGSALALAHFDVQHVGQSGNSADDFTLIKAGKTEPQRA